MQAIRKAHLNLLDCHYLHHLWYNFTLDRHNHGSYKYNLAEEQ